MRLSQGEFDGMSHPVRLAIQRHLELPLMKRAGLDVRDKEVLEIGCGAGYGAELLLEGRPRSYVGVDLMEEQIERARRRHLAGAVFRVADATDLDWIADESRDVIVIFGILHHVPEWRRVVAECRRILRPGGALVVEEPDGRAIRWWDRLVEWGHAPEAYFQLDDLARAIEAEGLRVVRRFDLGIFGVFGVSKSADPTVPSRR